MTTNYRTDDPILGQIDLDDYFIRDQWLIDQFVGSRLYGWGGNTGLGDGGSTVVTGAVGSGNAVNYSSPIQIGSLSNWRSISGGAAHVAAVKNDGTLWVWGSGTFVGGGNAFGELGIGSTGSGRSSPFQVGSLTNWKLTSCGKYNTAAIKTDGTLWVWGDNTFGQLGTSNLTPRSSPFQVGSLTNWKLVSCGSYHMAAIKTDGTLWTWGFNNYGQLGDNSARVHRSSPFQVGSLTNWSQVTTDIYHNVALKTDGTLWTWGNNDYGQLGDNSARVHRSSPFQVGSLTNWKSIINYGGAWWSGFIFSPLTSAAVKTDGTLWTWGESSTGQLGLGNFVHRSSPFQVGSLTNWRSISKSGAIMTAIKTDGTLWVWGSQAEVGGTSASGELGVGNSNLDGYSSPVQVGSMTGWKSVSGTSRTVSGIVYTDI